MKKLLVASAIALLGHAHAAESGFYITAGVGASVNDVTQSDVDTLSNELVAAGFSSARVEAEKSTAAAKIGVGYKINKHLAIDVAFMDLGTFEHEITTTGPTAKFTAKEKYRGTALSVIGSLPVSEAWSLFGRIGYLDWKNKFSISGCAVGGGCVAASASESGSDPIYGLGANWEISHRWGLTMEWNRTNLKFDGDDTTLNLFLASGRFKF